MRTKHFQLHNIHGVSPIMIGILSVGIGIIALVAGYFWSESIDTISSVSDPVIDDSVRPGSVRAVQGKSVQK